jgi:rhamnosyltransferase
MMAHPRRAARNPGEISIVIPVLNAEEFLPALMEAIVSQSMEPAEIILVDSGSSDGTRSLAAGYEKVRLISIAEFTHGKARNLGARMAIGGIVVFMSQDALPLDRHWLEELVDPLHNAGAGASYSRQVPKESASPMERFFLHTRFPEEARLQRNSRSGGELGFEEVFFSNVSSAVRKPLLEECPFDEDLIMSEDQKLSKDLLEKGHTVAYASRSVVVHSHEYTLSEVFKRYFDSAYSLDQIFASHTLKTSAAIGLPYLWGEFEYVLQRHPKWIPYYIIYTVAKTLGTVAGHWAPFMPRPMLRRLSLHSYHWDR